MEARIGGLGFRGSGLGFEVQNSRALCAPGQKGILRIAPEFSSGRLLQHSHV